MRGRSSTVHARSALAWAGILVLAGPVAARGLQESAAPDGVEQASFPAGVEEVDRVVAIVGDTVILASELDIRMYRLQAQGARVPPEGTPEWTRFAGQVIAAEIDRLIIIQEARRLGLTADPTRVESAEEELYQRARQGFASDEELMRAVEASGMNMLQYRQMLRADAEAQELIDEYRLALQRRTDLPPVVVTESEVEAFFQENASDQRRPALLSFNQLIVTPTPSGAARDSAIARTLQVQAELAAGESFEVVARRHSDDAGTREEGGELGWVRRDDMLRPFADAAWSSRPGQTIGPVQTRFGLHIIRIERERGSERFLRHVLIRPEITGEDVEEARALAGQLADSLNAGVDPERLARTFRGEVADEQIRFDDIPLDQLTGRFTQEYADRLGSPEPGEVYGPFPVEQGGPTEFALIEVVAFREEGPIELDDFRDQIRRQIRLSKQMDLLIEQVRENTYIDVKL